MKSTIINKVNTFLFLTIVFILLLTPYYPSFSSERFSFNFRKGQQFQIEALTSEDIYKNDVFIKNSKSKTTGELKIIDFEGKKALHKGIYRDFIYNKSYGNYELESEYNTEFYRDIFGHYQIDRNIFMPVVRDVPVFPDKSLEVGDQWTFKAYEAHDFRKAFGIKKPVIFPAAASYQYLGDKNIDNVTISKFSINYVINYTMRYSNNANSLTTLPYRIIGYFNQLFLWNHDKNLPDSYRENFDFILIMNNGDVIEYVGKSHGQVKVLETNLQKDKELSNIKEQLSGKIPGINVTRSSEGIVINVGEILFKFDSDELSPEATEDLDNIVRVLKDYPDRRIRIIGYTDSSGPEDYNLSLSLRRSKRTVTEIIKREPKLKGKLTYLGMGEKMPLASNETKEGRKKNRRVEIIILNK